MRPRHCRRSASAPAPTRRWSGWWLTWSSARRSRAIKVLVMSNGGFGGVHQKLLDALAAAG